MCHQYWESNMGSGGSKKLHLINLSSSNAPLKSTPPHRRHVSVPANLGSSRKNVEVAVAVHKSSHAHVCYETRHSFCAPSPLSTSKCSPTSRLSVISDNIEPHSEKKAATKMLPQRVPPKVDADGVAVTEDNCWTATELYNVLAAESWLGKPQLCTSTYLLLLDCRSHDLYEKSHILTAKHRDCLNSEFGCLLHVPGQLESFDMIVLYEDSNGNVAKELRAKKLPVYQLRSTFSVFKTKYPFLCTADIVSSLPQRELCIKTWPSEILDQRLYQGSAAHVSDREIVENLRVTHIVNVTLDRPNHFPDRIKYMSIRLDDESSVDLMSWLPKTSKFIAEAIGNTKDLDETNKNRVLVHCNMGRSRSSTVVLGYLMEKLRWSLQDASDWLKDCRPTAKPNIGFLNQLTIYETKVFGHAISDFNSLPF